MREYRGRESSGRRGSEEYLARPVLVRGAMRLSGGDPTLRVDGEAGRASRLDRCELCICHTCGPVVQ